MIALNAVNGEREKIYIYTYAYINIYICLRGVSKSYFQPGAPRPIHQGGRSLGLSDSVSAYEMEHLQELPESM